MLEVARDGTDLLVHEVADQVDDLLLLAAERGHACLQGVIPRRPGAVGRSAPRRSRARRGSASVCSPTAGTGSIRGVTPLIEVGGSRARTGPPGVVDLPPPVTAARGPGGRAAPCTSLTRAWAMPAASEQVGRPPARSGRAKRLLMTSLSSSGGRRGRTGRKRGSSAMPVVAQHDAAQGATPGRSGPPPARRRRHRRCRGRTARWSRAGRRRAAAGVRALGVVGRRAHPLGERLEQRHLAAPRDPVVARCSSAVRMPL